MSYMRSCGVFPTESRGFESLQTTLPSPKIAPSKNWGRLCPQQLPLRVPRRVPDGFQFFPTTKRAKNPNTSFCEQFPASSCFFFFSCLPDAKDILWLGCRAGKNACRCRVIEVHGSADDIRALLWSLGLFVLEFESEHGSRFRAPRRHFSRRYNLAAVLSRGSLSR